MALGKLLNLGGMENKLPKTTQTNGKFRVARNVYRAPDNRLIPRYDCEEHFTTSGDDRYIHYYTQYDNSMLSVRSYDNLGFYDVALFKDSTKVPAHDSVFGLSWFNSSPGEYDISNSIMSYRVGNTVYFQSTGPDRTKVKYDGVELSAMGVPQPRVGCAEYSAAGTTWIRVIRHRIDLDVNEPVSEFVQFPTTPYTVGANKFVDIRTDLFGPSVIGNTGVTPAIATSDKPNLTTPYFKSSAVFYDTSTESFNFTITDTNIDASKIGTYVIVYFKTVPAATSGLTYDVLGVMLKIKNYIPPTPAPTPAYVWLDINDAYVLDYSRTWNKVNLSTFTSGFYTAITFGTREIFTAWASAGPTSNYVYRGIFPAFQYSTTSSIYPVDVTSNLLPIGGSTDTIFDISQNLGDWYDVQSSKVSSNISLGGSQSTYGMTFFQDLLLFWDEDFIWYSDTTLPLNYEQMNALNFLPIGVKEDGRVISCCGTSDFLFVSRERKNYFVVGNIVTRNYRVQEIQNVEIGCWSNNSSILIKDSVIFITSSGVFVLSGGGACTKISESIPKNFSRRDAFAVDEDVKFLLEGTSAPLTHGIDYGLSVAFDEYRELLLFMQKGANYLQNPILVLDTVTYQFYEWCGVVQGKEYASAIGAMNGEYYIGGFDKAAGTLDAKTYKENKTLDLSYVQAAPVELFTTWLTAGEPSLEKQLLQLKIFGRIYGKIKVQHYKDWDITSNVTNAEYVSLGSNVYSHKKRFQSDKVLAASCGFILDDTQSTFELESIEVEFNPIQQGMKK